MDQRHFRFGGLGTLVATLVLVASSCGDDAAERAEAPSPYAQSLQATSEPPPPPPPGVPADLSFSIVREDVLPGSFRILDVRLSRPVAEDVVEALARHLRSQDPREYEAIYIVYYLPEMEPDAGGWATSHFTPDLEVRILGANGEP